MNPLTVQKIIEIHHDIVEEFGGVDGVLNEATLDYLVFRANQISDPFKRAALSLYCIAVKHPLLTEIKELRSLLLKIFFSKRDFLSRLTRKRW